MYRYVWEAYHDNGSVITRFALDGTERVPDPWYTRQIQFFSLQNTDAPRIRIHIPKGAYFTLETLNDTFIASWELPDGGGCALYLRADGNISLIPQS